MMNKNQSKEYLTPSVEFIELVIDGNILNMSVGVGGWDDGGEDHGGVAQ